MVIVYNQSRTYSRQVALLLVFACVVTAGAALGLKHYRQRSGYRGANVTRRSYSERGPFGDGMGEYILC